MKRALAAVDETAWPDRHAVRERRGELQAPELPEGVALRLVVMATDGLTHSITERCRSRE